MFDPDFTRGTDKYFLRTKHIVADNGDVRATYALFMRVPIIFAPRIMLDWLDHVAAQRNIDIAVETPFEEGERVGGGEPLAYISGSLEQLVDLETHILQRLGPPCVAAFNAYRMCCDLPHVEFLAMDARHCAGSEMAEMMAYAAGVGSRAARRDTNAVGFIGNATDATAHFFGNEEGLGTMPHGLIGYAGSTLRAAQMFHTAFPDEVMTVLVDYYGQEVTDTLAVARRFPDLAVAGRLAVRLDTHGGRFIEGLDPAESYAVIERHAPEAIRQYRTEAELRWLVGTGVSASALWFLRENLDAAGFKAVRIVASSGFNPAKCAVMASAKAPINVVGTGSYLPERWEDSYATADIIEYDGRSSVKVGREFLLSRRKAKRINGKNGSNGAASP